MYVRFIYFIVYQSDAKRSEGVINETKRDLKKDERFKERENRRFVFW